MTTSDRLLSVLGLFTIERPEWTVEEAANELQLAASTTYRYFRSLSKEKQDFLQGFFDFDDATLRAAFDALLEKFAPRVTVSELYQNANTNEHSAELVGKLTQHIHEHA